MITKKDKKIKILIIFVFLYMTLALSGNTSYAQYLNISAEGAVLIDVNSGRILYEKNPDKKMKIASLTKIMTAIIAIEEESLENIVETSDNAYGTEGSSIYLKRGEELTLENMLYGLMLRSGNDAAVAISEHVGGSIEGFAYLMNNKAAFLGMNNSYFTNPHGLDNENHYSTPRDMAILTAYALKNPVFNDIVSTKIKTVPQEDEDWDKKWVNKNKMLYLYEWADGVKTGYTKLAKRCLASSATKDGIQLACITLNAPDDWNDHKKLLEYGFNNYDVEVLVDVGDYIDEININGDIYEIISDSKLSYPLKVKEDKLITKKIIINEELDKDKYFENVGSIEFYLDDKFIGKVLLKIKEKKQTY